MDDRFFFQLGFEDKVWSLAGEAGLTHSSSLLIYYSIVQNIHMIDWLI